MARRVLSEGADPGSGTCIRITPVRRHRTQGLVLFAAAARVLRALVRADATRFRLHRERQSLHFTSPAAARRRTTAREFPRIRSEEHTSELQSLMRISYAVFSLKNKNTKTTTQAD